MLSIPMPAVPMPAVPMPAVPMPVPTPLTAAQERERRVRWLAIVTLGQRQHRLVSGRALMPGMSAPGTPGTPGPARPAQCRFTDAAVLRVPLTLTARGREALWRCHHEARQFPQALEEHFGLHSGVARIEVDACTRAEAGIAELRDPRSLTPRAQIAPHTLVLRDPERPGAPLGKPVVRVVQADDPAFPAHIHPDRALVRVTIHHRQPDTYPPHTFLLPLYQFHELHTRSHLPAMRAARTARQLLDLYPHPPLPNDGGGTTKE